MGDLTREQRVILNEFTLIKEWRNSWTIVADPNNLQTPDTTEYDVLMLDVSLTPTIEDLDNSSHWANRRHFNVTEAGHYNLYVRTPILSSLEGRVDIHGDNVDLAYDSSYMVHMGDYRDFSFWYLSTAPDRLNKENIQVFNTVDAAWQFELISEVRGLIPKGGVDTQIVEKDG